MTAQREFTCAQCCGVFPMGDDSEALAELSRNFPGWAAVHCTLLCDGCYKPPSNFNNVDKSPWQFNLTFEDENPVGGLLNDLDDKYNYPKWTSEKEPRRKRRDEHHRKM